MLSICTRKSLPALVITALVISIVACSNPREESLKQTAYTVLSGLSTGELGWYCRVVDGPRSSNESCEEVYRKWLRLHPEYSKKARQWMKALDADKYKISTKGDTGNIQIKLPGGNQQTLVFRYYETGVGMRGQDSQSWYFDTLNTNRANPGQVQLP